jgi:hypothetical protein
MEDHNNILLVIVIAAFLALLTVVLHFEALNGLSKSVGYFSWAGRSRIVLLFCVLLLVHIVEIWIFAFGFIFANYLGSMGELNGAPHGLLDYVYFSSMTYTTVGYGDLYPKGAIRFIAAMESLLGLMLITWSASFTYLEMQQFWKKQ